MKFFSNGFHSFLLLLVLSLFSCRRPSVPVVSDSAPPPPSPSVTVTNRPTVEIVRENGRFALLRHGQPYFIKGAGGSNFLSELDAAGGNSIRTWSTQNGQEVLDQAHQHGHSVTMGLNVARERHGFDYDDAAAVARQLASLRQEVRKYKDHPALLMWGIGNELNLNSTNPRVWDAVNDIARMIHEEDPNHPATTMLAGINKKNIDLIKERCPDLDLLAVQTYGSLPKVPQQIRETGWEGAYIVTEWGPTGHWEVAKTSWGAPIEETSHEKAQVYQQRYEASIQHDKDRCLGSYVFLWGQKQERTPTWYGMFTEAGKPTEVVDVMQYLWTRNWPDNRAPRLDSLRLDSKGARQNVTLSPAKSYAARVFAADPEGGQLQYAWELLPEATDLGEGGDRESRPQPIPDLISPPDGGIITLKAPAQPGAYRLFVYVYDSQRKTATANIPFYVSP
jgi:hypothetical protein